MIVHSVNMFRNSSVVHDLSTSKDYSTVLYKFVSIWDAKKKKEKKIKLVWKKANSWTKTATVISSKNIESNKMKS